jgi:hypothetical protein
MNKYWKIASFVASGLVIGAIMGKVATQELGKGRKALAGKNVKNVKSYSDSYYDDEDDHVYFV